jgi:hypothetical protein
MALSAASAVLMGTFLAVTPARLTTSSTVQPKQNLFILTKKNYSIFSVCATVLDLAAGNKSPRHPATRTQSRPQKESLLAACGNAYVEDNMIH